MQLNLPYPPSVNHYWRHRQGRFYIAKEGIKYREDVWLATRGLGKMEGRLRVFVLAIMPDRRIRDIDNILKALLDALKHAGIYEDDSQIDDLRIVRGAVLKPGGVSVEIEEITHPIH